MRIWYSVRSHARSDRIRVVACLDNLGIGGTELNAIRTLEHLDRSRFDPFLVTLAAEGPLRSRVDALGIPVLHLPLGPSLLSLGTLRAAVRLASQLRAWGADVVHCHDRYTNLVGSLAGRLARVPLVIASRRWGETTRAHRLVGIVAYHLAHRVLANSPGTAAALAEAEFVAPHRIDVVPNFVEAEAFVPPAPAWIAQSRKALGIPAEAPVVGVVASLRPVKELGTLLEAAALLSATHPSLRVVLVGVGPSGDQLVAQAVRLGLGERAIFSGYQPATPSMHALFDVSVLTSRSEGFPNSVIEAMAAGRPVVGTNVIGIRDAILDGRTGYLVPRGNAQLLAAALARLLNDAALRATFGSAARELALERYEPTVVLRQLFELYGSGVARRSPQTGVTPDGEGPAWPVRRDPAR